MAAAALLAWYAELCGVGSTLDTDVLLTMMLGDWLRIDAGDEEYLMRSGRKACVIEMYDHTFKSNSCLPSAIDISEMGMLYPTDDPRLLVSEIFFPQPVAPHRHRRQEPIVSRQTRP